MNRPPPRFLRFFVLVVLGPVVFLSPEIMMSAAHAQSSPQANQAPVPLVPQMIRDRSGRTNTPDVYQGVQGSVPDGGAEPSAVPNSAPVYRVNPTNVSDGIPRQGSLPEVPPQNQQAPNTAINVVAAPTALRQAAGGVGVQDRIGIEPSRQELRDRLPKPADVLRNFRIFFAAIDDPIATVECDRTDVRLTDITLSGIHPYNAVQTRALSDADEAFDGLVFLNATVYFNGRIVPDAPVCANLIYRGQVDLVHLLSDTGQIENSGVWYVPDWRRSLTRR